MANSVEHVELTTSDVPKARAFYSELFGWQFEDHPMEGGGTYSLSHPDEGAAAGIMASPAGAPTAWTMFVNVDDINAIVMKARALGANIVRDVTDVPGYGALSIVADPTGAVFGLWENRR